MVLLSDKQLFKQVLLCLRNNLKHIGFLDCNLFQFLLLSGIFYLSFMSSSILLPIHSSWDGYFILFICAWSSQGISILHCYQRLGFFFVALHIVLSQAPNSRRKPHLQCSHNIFLKPFCLSLSVTCVVTGRDGWDSVLCRQELQHRTCHPREQGAKVALCHPDTGLFQGLERAPV